MCVCPGSCASVDMAVYVPSCFTMLARTSPSFLSPRSAGLNPRAAFLVPGGHVPKVRVPRPWEMKEKFDLITADWTYVLWLGDRKGIEEQTKAWDKTILNSESEIAEWVRILKRVVPRGIESFAYANNHYAGHAPATVKLFWDTWNKKKMEP